ncbi:MAG: hypothetical protein H6Q72_955 [Firmicutes bacterium]|nr:hypothetical protein [Bacillota bacterium]
MLPGDRRRQEQKKQDETAKLERDKFNAMIQAQMNTPQGRKFVYWVLWLLQYNQPNPHNSAQAYRVAAMQGVAIEIHRQIYGIVPNEVEKMIREGVEGS